MQLVYCKYRHLGLARGTTLGTYQLLRKTCALKKRLRDRHRCQPTRCHSRQQVFWQHFSDFDLIWTEVGA